MMARLIIAVALVCLLSGCTGQQAPGEAGEAEAETGPAAVADERSSAEAQLSVAADDTTPTEAAETSAQDDNVPEQEPEPVDLSRTAESEGVLAGRPEEGAVEIVAAATELVGEPAQSPTGLRVLRAYVCKGIEQSEPTEAGKSFIPEDDGVLRLCCFSELAGPAGPDTIHHVWRWGDREMARVELAIEGPRWRTWSTKRVLDEWKGEWHVDIVDRTGFVLERLEFSVE